MLLDIIHSSVSPGHVCFGCFDEDFVYCWLLAVKFVVENSDDAHDGPDLYVSIMETSVRLHEVVQV